MRLVHVITGLSTGGAELMLLRLAESLHREFDQTVVSLTDLGPVGEKLQATGIPVFALGMEASLPSPSALLRLVRILRRINPDVVQTWLYHADLVGGLAAKIAGIRIVAWNVRNNDLSADKTSLRTRAVVKACGLLSAYFPNRIVYCSQAAMATHQALGYSPDKTVILPNGFDTDRFRPDTAARIEVRNELGLAPHTSLVGLIARFDPQKNHALFFEAAGRLHRRLPGVHFLLAGRGVDANNAAILNWVGEAEIADVVHLLGERSDMPRLTAALDIASSSSWGESFPNVLGEAMACGVPCVATDAGDSAYIVADTGRIVPRGDAEALASAWEELLKLPEEKRQLLGALARTRVAEHFELGTIAHRYSDLYRQLASISLRR